MRKIAAEFLNEKGEPHRLNNLPALIFDNGDRTWMVNGNHQRTNGPAIIQSSGIKRMFYVLNGKQEFPEKQMLWINEKEII